jgi:predicted TIM-barrel fold metal-dependent hydrolase
MNGERGNPSMFTSKAFISKTLTPGAESRRDFLAGWGTLAAGALGVALAGASTSRAQSSSSKLMAPRRIIDVHHHIMPPFYIHEHRRDQLKVGPGITQIFEWIPEQAIERMDASGVAASILSISTPGPWFGQKEEGRRLSRQINDYAAKMRETYPGRFGLFAAIPLPDTEGSMKEIEYAFDTLKADGIGLMTSYDSLPVGSREFAPVFDELNRRKAIVFLHRTVASCCMNLRGLPGDKEFIIDDLRALNSLLTGGTLARCPDLRLIHAHGDKTLPWVAHHIGAGGGGEGRGGGRGNPAYAPQGVLHELQKIYVDTAGNSQDTMDDMRELGMMDQIMFGTDNPYGGSDAVRENLNRLMGFQLTQDELDAIGRGTALKLLPKFA